MLFRLKQVLATTLLAVFLALTCTSLTPAAYAFSDDAGDWYSETIQKAETYGLMQGRTDGSFGVGEDISRAEFVTVLCRMFAWETVAPETPTFSDCPANKWYYSSVETAAAHGVAEPTGAFRPDDPISRQEMAVMLVNALGYADLAQGLDGAALPFDDVAENAGYIAIAYDFGMTNGVPGPNGTVQFLPNDSAPREQAAAMLVRVYERYVSKTDWLHGFYAFSSYSQIGLATQMDWVSMGWARMEYTPEGGFVLNSTRSGGNDWVMPADPAASTGQLSEAGVPYSLNVFASTAKTVALPDGTSTSVLEALLTDPQAAQAAVEVLAAASADYAGITIDFEGLKSEDWRAPYAKFLADLRAALPQDKALFVCVPPDTWYHAYDYRAIGDVADKVIFMAHDYQWTSVPEDYVGTPNTYSPVTPLDQIYTALRHITDPETGVQDKSKIALQISFGTAGFHVDQDGFLVDTGISHLSPATIAQRLTQPDSVVTWDEVSRNPFLSYTDDEGEHRVLWYEDARSVDAKLRLARMFGITGVSAWRLGTIPNYPEIEHYDTWPVFTDR